MREIEKEDYKNGDSVTIEDSEFNRKQNAVGLIGTVAMQDDCLGLLVRLDGVKYLNYEGIEQQKYIYYLKHEIKNLIKND